MNVNIVYVGISQDKCPCQCLSPPGGLADYKGSNIAASFGNLSYLYCAYNGCDNLRTL